MKHTFIKKIDYQPLYMKIKWSVVNLIMTVKKGHLFSSLGWY
jgi:hypothetical protein